VPHLSAARFLSHFYAPLGLLLGGLVAAQQSSLNEFFTSLFNVLPTVLLLLGGAFCIAYGRIREASLLLLIYLAYFLLDTQADHYRISGALLPEAALTFHLCSLLLPVLYGVYGLWLERAHFIAGWAGADCCAVCRCGCRSGVGPAVSSCLDRLADEGPLAFVVYRAAVDPIGLSGVSSGAGRVAGAVLEATSARPRSAADRIDRPADYAAAGVQ